MRETIEYKGAKFHRYPNSPYLSDGRYFKGWVDERKTYLHRYVWECNNGEIPKGYHVHHKDYNFSNNEIENLELVHASKHLSDHYKNQSQEFKDEKNRILQECARPEAAKWHRSEAGRKWHRKHAIGTIIGDVRELVCKECGESFETSLKREVKFCSRKCKSRYNMRVDRSIGKWDEERQCIVCGEKFKIYKWSKGKTCSKKCAAYLRHNRTESI